MELHGIGKTRRQRPIGAIPPTPLENRGKRFITIDPTVGSRSNFFHEFLEAIFDGVAWNRYDTPTASGQGHSTNSTRESGQQVYNYRSDCWIALKLFYEFLEAVFDRVAWMGTTRRRRPVGAIPPTTLENRVKRFITINPTVGSRSNFFHEFP